MLTSSPPPPSLATGLPATAGVAAGDAAADAVGVSAGVSSSVCCTAGAEGVSNRCDICTARFLPTFFFPTFRLPPFLGCTPLFVAAFGAALALVSSRAAAFEPRCSLLFFFDAPFFAAPLAAVLVVFLPAGFFFGALFPMVLKSSCSLLPPLGTMYMGTSNTSRAVTRGL